MRESWLIKSEVGIPSFMNVIQISGSEQGPQSAWGQGSKSLRQWTIVPVTQSLSFPLEKLYLVDNKYMNSRPKKYILKIIGKQFCCG